MTPASYSEPLKLLLKQKVIEKAANLDSQHKTLPEGHLSEDRTPEAKAPREEL